MLWVNVALGEQVPAALSGVVLVSRGRRSSECTLHGVSVLVCASEPHVGPGRVPDTRSPAAAGAGALAEVHGGRPGRGAGGRTHTAFLLQYGVVRRIL